MRKVNVNQKTQSAEGPDDDPEQDARLALRLIDRVKRYQHAKATPVRTDETVSSFAGSQTKLPMRMGDIEIVEEIGVGGFGVVYRGTDHRLNRQVAVKIPKMRTAITQQFQERFEREARAAAALSHANIVPVFEAGSWEQIPFIAGEYICGESLDKWIDSKPTEAKLAARMVAILADAIAHAHQRGVFHRDIKPANVLVENAESDNADVSTRLRLTDFGLAKVIDENSDQTQTGSLIGTPAYMAPETIDDPGSVNAQADIYSLGSLLYELLAGKPPFAGETVVATLEKVRNEDPKPLSCFAVTPPDLEAICFKCLEKNPVHRYGSAFELKEDLNCFINGLPVKARRVSQLDRLLRTCKRNPALSATTAIAALLTVCVAIGSSYAAFVFAGKNEELRQKERESLNNLEAAIVAKDKATKNETLAIRAIYEARVSEAQAHRRSQTENARSMALSSIDKAIAHIDRIGLKGEDLSTLRNETISAMSMMGLKLEKQWPGIGHRSSQIRVAFSSDATRYARIEDDFIAVRSVEDNRLLQKVPAIGETESERRPFLLFSPSGKFLAVRGKHYRNGRKFMVQVWKLDDIDEPVISQEVAISGFREAIDFSSDDRLVAFGDTKTKIVVKDLSTFETVSTIETASDAKRIKFDPTSKRLAVSSEAESFTISICDAISGKPTGTILEHSSDLSSAAWHPNGRWLATGTLDGSLTLWDVKSGETVTRFQGHLNKIMRLAFNHQGTLLMSTAWDSTTRLWDTVSGQQRIRTMERGYDFSKDGSQLTMAVAGSIIGRWDILKSECHVTLPVQATWATFYNDNRVLALRTSKGIELWDVEAQKRLAAIPGNFHSLGFSADGSELRVSSRGKRVQTWRFPLTWSDDKKVLTVGIAVKDSIGKGYDRLSHASFSSNSSIVTAELDRDFVTVFDMSRKDDKEIARLPGIKQRKHIVSSDGSFVVTGSWKGKDAGIWKSNGESILKLSIQGSANVKISPDDRWVAILAQDRATLIDTSTWKTHVEVPHRPFAYSRASFSKDGRIAAITTGNEVTVVDVPARKILARIEPPIPTTYGTVALSPNARWLLIADGSYGSVQAWDLSLLRKKLNQRKIDWEDESLFAPDDSDLPSFPLEVHVAED